MKNLVPFGSRTSLFDEMFNTSLRNIFNDSTFSSKNLYANIVEEKDKYIVKAEIPGLSEDDVKLDFENGTISIEASYKEESKNSFRSGSWNWSYYIPNIDADKINASLKDGILTVELLKQEKILGKKIQINK